jgi:FkbM family methyltransferase
MAKKPVPASKPGKEFSELRRQIASLEAKLARISRASSRRSPRQKATGATRSKPPRIAKTVVIEAKMEQADHAPVFELREVKAIGELSESNPGASDPLGVRLIDQLRFKWLCGKWHELGELDFSEMERQRERHWIAALAASALLHLGKKKRARQMLSRAIRWGLDPRRAAELILSDLHRTMAEAHYMSRNHQASKKHLLLSGVGDYALPRLNPIASTAMPVGAPAVTGQRGLSMSDDLRAALPDYEVRTIFDVGSNEGQTVRTFLREYPASNIYCFEPAITTYQALESSYGGFPQIQLFRKAFGSRRSIAELEHGSGSTMSRVCDQNPELPGCPGATRELVEMDTLDAFCAERGTSHIDLLKIDTEGGDLDVLQGAGNLLAQQSVDLISVEAAMSRLNRRHCQFDSLQHHLENRGYYLFGVYEQKSEWISRQPHLRRANALFISGALIETITGRTAVSIPDREKST